MRRPTCGDRIRNFFPSRYPFGLLEIPYRIILASASPRRKELLGRIVSEFEIIPPDLDEEAFNQPVPWQTARDLAFEKASLIHGDNPEALVIGGDTVVALPVQGGYDQLGKPKDTWDAVRMLKRLSGIEHLVITGVCLKWPGGTKSFEVTSGVKFRKLSESEIKEYVACGESMDKAGSYAVQGRGASFIEGMRGSLTNVMGFPVDEVREELAKLTLDIPS